MLEAKNLEEISRYIDEFCAVKDRSARIKINNQDLEWQYGVLDDVKRPAASLMKIVLAISVENRIKDNSLDSKRVIAVKDLVNSKSNPSILNSFDSEHLISIIELVQLCLSISDSFATSYLAQLLTTDELLDTLRVIGTQNSYLEIKSNLGSNTINGTTSAKDALKILEFGSSSSNYPITASGLKNSVLNSRIPIGIKDFGTGLSHKTGTLLSVAHDVAIIQCQQGFIALAFLTENQNDTLQTGYEMGMCTKRIIETIGFTPLFSRSYD